MLLKCHDVIYRGRISISFGLLGMKYSREDKWPPNSYIYPSGAVIFITELTGASVVLYSCTVSPFKSILYSESPDRSFGFPWLSIMKLPKSIFRYIEV